MRSGWKLDFRQLPDGHVVTAAEVETELDRIGYRLLPPSAATETPTPGLKIDAV